ncbi:MAG: Ig-like domain-containing protein [Gallionellaceae bacterium]|nr:Ig-like domain-containing protein [Gallionellaceae bacterium]
MGNPTLTSIAITPGNSSIAFGSTAQFTAIGTYSDSTTQNITKLVTWSSSNPVVATVNNAGDARGLAFLLTPGNITITATLAGVTGTTPLIVANSTLVSIAVTPANPSTTLGSTVQFTAIGTYSDNSTQNLTKLVTWSSATTSIVVVSNAADSNGLAHVVGNASGSSVITAISGSIFGATTLTVP